MVTNGLLPCLYHFLQILTPHQRRRCTMTDEVDSDQLTIGLSQETMKTRYLTRCTTKQYLTTRLQEAFALLIAIACTSLHVFTTSKSSQSFYMLSIINDYLPLLIKASTKYDTPSVTPVRLKS